MLELVASADSLLARASVRSLYLSLLTAAAGFRRMGGDASRVTYANRREPARAVNEQTSRFKHSVTH